MSRSLSTKDAVKGLMRAWLESDDAWSNGTAGVSVALFSNDYVPAADDVKANFTAVTTTGAAAKTAVKPSDIVVFPDGTITITLAELTPFTPTVEPDPAVTAYGYFIFGTVNNNLLAARRFDDPIQLHDGVSIIIDAITPAPIVWQFNDPSLP
jgi:hypothetical protein